MAGVNERTFFRHFPDKREVLFDGESDLRAALMQAVAEAPEGLQPLEILLCAFRKVERILEDNRPFAEPRLQVIAATPALRERDLAKAASIAEALAEALRQGGVTERLAGLAARTGWAAFHQAVQAWIDDPSQSLDAHLLQAFDDLRALSLTALPAQARPEG
ncbi:TetR/AcrR family transcriptional regulator [Microbispora siamensis]